MCGIVGLFNGEKHTHQMQLDKFLITGCITGVVRGMDSTGIYQVQDDKTVRIYKKPLSGYDFVQLKAAQELLGNAHKTVATVIHHRAATHGSVSQENAHPFDHESEDNYIVGVHNGTVQQFNRKEGGLHFNVDSDWLYYKILTEGPQKALGDLNDSAAYALVWYDQLKDKHYIAANGQRPISWGFVKGKNVMLFASEHQHLYWMASRYGLQFEEEIWSPQNNVVYEFDADDLRKYKTFDIPKQEKIVIPKKSISSWDAGTASWKRSRGAGIGEDTPQNKINIQYDKKAILDEGIGTDKQYNFWPDFNTMYLSEDWPRLVEGLLVNSENEDEYYDAITVVNESRFSELEACSFATAFPIAVRTVTNKATAHITKQIYATLTGFHQIEQYSKGEELYVGPRGKNLTEAKFKEMVSGGCINCSCEITPKQQDLITWVNNGTDPMCPDCVDKQANVVQIKKGAKL